MASHLYMEIQFICISFFAVMLWRLVVINDQRTSQLYLRGLAVCGLVCFCFDLAQAVVNAIGPAGHIGLLYFFHIMYFLALGAAAYDWYLFSECEQGSTVATSRKLQFIATIPFIITGILAVSAPANHLMFYLDDQGTYVRGPWYFAQVGLCGLYLLATSLKAYWLAHKATNTANRNHLLIVGSLIVPTIITAVLQVVWPNLPILCAGACDSLLFGYIAMQEQHIFVDPLTKVNNRRRMVQNLETLIGHARDNNEPFGLLIIDVDKFKGINDTYGHVEGDNALVHIARAITSVARQGVNVYRYGGDEFVVTSEESSDEALAALARQIQAAVASEGERMGVPYRLGVSVGYTRFELSDAKPDDIVGRADSQLYEAKRGRRQAAAA